ncbi:MAG: hypothetical protein HY674_04375 [Chloroflexi bacterium]|nr:hypothetical protein [Chloroflexota bacterium]
MRLAFVILLCAGFLVGCKHPRAAKQVKPGQTVTGSEAPSASRLPSSAPAMSPAQQLAGQVVSVNERLRYVILDFSLSRLPEIEQRFHVYREGQKVGEVKISGPSQNMNIAADILAGEAKVGDEVRRY